MSRILLVAQIAAALGVIFASCVPQRQQESATRTVNNATRNPGSDLHRNVCGAEDQRRLDRRYSKSILPRGSALANEAERVLAVVPESIKVAFFEAGGVIEIRSDA